MPVFPNALLGILSTRVAGPVRTTEMMLCSTLNCSSGRRISRFYMSLSKTSTYGEVLILSRLRALVALAALMMTLGYHSQKMAKY